MNTNIIQNQLKLYQRLHSILPKTKKIEDKRTHSETVLHFDDEKSFWFAKEEKHDKFYYYFGLTKNTPITLDNATLTIDISKEQEYKNDCIGWLIQNSKGIKLLLNLDILTKRYPQINLDNFKPYHVKSGKISRNYIDLDYIESDHFIKNLESIIDKSKLIKKDKKTIKKANSNLCEICQKDKANGKPESRLKKLHKIKPGLCGNCIEKIAVCEFFKKIEPLIITNETKTLKITREKYSNEEEFDFGIKLLEKYNIIHYIGVKKLFFTIDKNNFILNEYMKYVDENDYLIDNVFDYKKYSVDEKIRMNLFINALKNGKTENDALRIAKLNSDDVEKYYELGKNGDENHVEFYENYDKFRIPNKEMNMIIRILRKTDLENALKKADVDFTTAKKWYDLGEKNHEGYVYFYRECNKLLPDGFVMENDEELINEFNQLRSDGKSNEEALKELKINNEKINKWINEAKAGNEKYTNFYTIYSNKKKHSCRICGRKINNINAKGICKRCEKKQFASKIVLKLLNHFDCEKDFKKEDLKVLDLRPMQITEYLWTLKEFNLIDEKNNKYQLKNMSILKEFIKSSGTDAENIPIKTNNEKSYKTCIKCKKSLSVKSNFKKGEDICKNCKKLNTIAEYLIELLEHADFNTKYREDDLSKYYENPFKMQAKLWALADNDLVKKDLDDNTYILTDKKTVDDFLNKYGDVKTTEKAEEKINKTQDNGILTLIPDELEKKLKKRSKGNKTGFAWVNKTGNRYTYSRTVDGKKIEIKDENIYNVYENVKKQGLIWGVRDLKKAKAIVEKKESTDIDSDIYAPLPEKYLKTFKSQSNKTGIAWVNETGKTFTYSRSVKGKQILLKEPSIEELYLKVKSLNGIWGIRDYKRAINYINIPDELIPENNNNEEILDIYSPLSKKYLSKELVKNTTTGIAWVSKHNNRWVYNYQENNQIIRLSDENINNLYKKVIENNGIWGITDIDKAEAIISSETKVKKTKITSRVNVNYIASAKNKLNIIINGRIKSNQLINTLSELKAFEKNFKRIITTSISNEVDLLIEIEINKNSKKSFEKTVRSFGWNIN